MGLLDQIHRGKRKQHRRILIYGTSGIGKSTLGKNAPRSVFVPIEKGIDNLDCHSLPPCRSFQDYINSLSALYSEPHDYQTVVTDSADWLERLIFADICRVRKVTSIDEIPYGKGPGFATPYWTEALAGLDALREERGMTIILLAHYKVEKVRAPDADTYDRYSPKLHPLANELLREWCDEVLFATYKVYTVSKDAGFNRTRAQAIGDGQRVLKTSERPAYLAKNRIDGLPEEIPLPRDAFPPELAQAL